MSVKILAINGSHRKGMRNTAVMLEHALKGAKETGPDIETELVHLYDKKLKICVHCDSCVGNYKPEARKEKLGIKTEEKKRHPGHALHGCIIKDDAAEVFAKIEEANAVIFGTPVYILGVSTQLKILIDRMRYMVHHNCLRWTVGAAMAQAYYQHGGQETTLVDISNAMRAFNMVVVGMGLGGAGVSGPSIGGPTPWEDDGKIAAVGKDSWSMKTAWWTGRIVADTARVIKAGLDNIPKEQFEKFWPKPHVG